MVRQPRRWRFESFASIQRSSVCEVSFYLGTLRPWDLGTFDATIATRKRHTSVMIKLYLALALSAISTAAFAQTDFSKVVVKAEKVSGSVYVITGAGGNIGVSVGEDGIVIVDDQFAPLAPKIKDALKGIADKPLRFVINTHYHGDHTGGNEAFGRDATIVAHDNTRRRLAEGTKMWGHTNPPSPKGALPIVTFDRTLTLHVNGEPLRAVHFAGGHTDGDIAIYFPKSNVVHTGDLFFNGSFPVVDLDHGGNVLRMADNVEKVIADLPDDVKVIPGHGPVGDKAAVRRFAQTLRDTHATIAAAGKAGKTVAQMKEEKLLAKWDGWAKGHINSGRWIDTIAAELKLK